MSNLSSALIKWLYLKAGIPHPKFRKKIGEGKVGEGGNWYCHLV